MDLCIERVTSPYLVRTVKPRPWQRETPTFEEWKASLFRRRLSGRRYTDLSITAAQVLLGSPATYTGKVIAGEALTAGQPVYFDSVAKQYFKAINTVALNSNGIATYAVAGIVLEGATTGQPFHFQTSGQIQLYTANTLVISVEYFLSATAGGICPIADVASGHRVIRLGYVDTQKTLTLDFKDLGTKP